MSERTFAVKELHYTIQGEGVYAGTPAVFVRFAGCNIWTGREEHRKENTANGICALFCDTDFVGIDGVGGGKYSQTSLVYKIRQVFREVGWVRKAGSDRPIVVFTGGEPMLQVTEELVETCQSAGFRVHIETNGSLPVPVQVDWVTLSPKPPMRVVVPPMQVSELKLVYPGTWPRDYELAYHGIARFIQPRWHDDPEIRAVHMENAIAFVKENSGWRLSLQTHKYMGVP